MPIYFTPRYIVPKMYITEVATPRNIPKLAIVKVLGQSQELTEVGVDQIKRGLGMSFSVVCHIDEMMDLQRY